MRVHIKIPYSIDKNLGKAYNDSMALIPDGDAACFMDYDCMLLTSDAGSIIQKYAEHFPNAVLTAFTNRIHPLNTEQLLTGKLDDTTTINRHIILARQQARNPFTVTEIHNHFSGFCFVVPKNVWQLVPFPDNGGCLGVDTDWFKALKRANIPVLRMNQVYVWHTYRLIDGIQNKEHLK